MTLPRRSVSDRELEQEARIKPPDHNYETPPSIRQRERALLGPSWGKKRRPFKAKGC